MPTVIKRKCVCCGDKIEVFTPEERKRHYNSYGNYCKVCSGKATTIFNIKSRIGYSEKEKMYAQMGYNEDRDKIIKRCNYHIRVNKIKLERVINSLPQYYRGNII